MIETLSQQQKQSLSALISKYEPRLRYGLFHHLTTRGKKMVWHNRPYMIPLYTDKSRNIVIRKSVQCGVTEWLIIDALTNCELGLATFYVLPTFNLRNTFVKNRLDKLFNMVPYYRTQMKTGGEADSMSIKHYSVGTMKFVGSNTPKEFVEFPADCVTIDEYDRCEQENLALAPDRIKSSKHKLTRMVGNPTLEDFGIDSEFKFSDQKHWVVKCESCNEYHSLDFFTMVMEEIGEAEYKVRDEEWTKDAGRDVKMYCPTCNAEFDRLNPDAHWQMQNPDSHISGYWFNRLMEPDTTVAEMLGIYLKAKTDTTKMQAFYNSDLGLPYSPKSVSLSTPLLDKCVRDYSLPQTSDYCVMGIDVGAVLHVKVSRVDGDSRLSQFIGTVSTFEAVDKIIKDYNVVLGVIDGLPETHEAKKLRQRHRGKMYLCTYHRSDGGVQEMKVNHDEGKVQVDRTQSMDESHSDILLQKNLFPKNARELDKTKPGAYGEFYNQMVKPKRVFDEKKGYYIWTDVKPDHYRHADNYEKIAMKILGKEPRIWVL